MFDQFLRFANTRGIGEAHGDAGEFGDFRDEVARCAGYGGDDGAVLFEEEFEEAAIAGVGTADDGELKAGADKIAVNEAAGQRAGLIDDRIEAAQNFGERRDADVVFGKVDACFE